MATIDLGRVTPIYKGEYSATTAYELNDIVLYSDGNLYWHIGETATTGTAPTDTTVWEVAFSGEDLQTTLEGLVSDAQGYATSASGYADNASDSASEASGYATSASGYADNASDSASQASGYATTASGYADDAEDSATAAASSATAAATSASEAATAAASASYISALPTETVSGSIVTFTDGADGIPVSDLTVAIEPVQDTSSGDPSPDNVCPISGWDSVTVTRCGVNVWDEEITTGYFNTTGGWMSSSSVISTANPITVIPDTTYYVYFGGSTSGVFITYWTEAVPSGTSATDYFISRSSSIISSGTTITIPSNCHAIHFNFGSAYGTTYNNDVSINYPSTDTDYHAYSGTSVTTSLGSTYYGGTLDVTTGVLTVDSAYIDLGSLTWQAGSEIFYSTTSPLFGSGGTALLNNSTNGYNNICDSYVNAAVSTSSPVDYCFQVANSQTVPVLRVSDSRYTDADSFATAVDGVMAVFKLYEPYTVTLTASELTTLLGDNTIYADSGDTTVTYRADIKTYIDNAIATAIS